ncbi:MAG: phosphate ABC transporter permease PstA [Anaerolineae bacterium]
MAAINPSAPKAEKSFMPTPDAFKRGLAARHVRGRVWRTFFFLSVALAMFALLALVYNVVNSAAGLIATEYQISPAEVIPGGDIDGATPEQLAAAMVQFEHNRSLVQIRDNLSRVPTDQFVTAPMSQVLPGGDLPAGIADKTIRELTDEELVYVLAHNLPADLMHEFVTEQIIGLNVLETWPLFESIFNRAAIEEKVRTEMPTTTQLTFRVWLSSSFITSRQSSDPLIAGIRSALLGTVWIVAVTVLVAFPIGVGAAIYLEEYSTPTNRFAFQFSRIIETNIRNLAGVPSIIYGLLGLAIFVRTFEALTSGAVFGVTDSNGRTIISASLTMALLILPIIIINAQEAIRAVPPSIREASYGLGATKWQTIWKQVLPAAMPGVLTGTILGMSRAIGETAPLVVIGASTLILVDPTSPFSSFTALPIQIYQWTARPEPEFRAIAAAAIIVLLALLLLLNATAIFLRQYFRKSLQG